MILSRGGEKGERSQPEMAISPCYIDFYSTVETVISGVDNGSIMQEVDINAFVRESRDWISLTSFIDLWSESNLTFIYNLLIVMIV